MTNCAELSDYDWLTGPQADVILRDLSDRRVSLHAVAEKLRRQLSAARAHLVLEQVELRERARAKFDHADQMFFTRQGLEQATDQWVAAYKARRFAGRGPIADLCCGIGGDLLSLANHEPTTGVDRDSVATHIAAANVAATLHATTAARVTLSLLDVEQFSACGLAAFHIDPDRRQTGTRTSSPNWSSPAITTIDRLLTEVPQAALKLAPTADIPAEWAERCELEWISRDRQCRQLVAWHGDLATAPGRRRATRLDLDGNPSSSVVGERDAPLPIAARIDRFIFEPDPAVLAAHLTGALAAKHDLPVVAPGVAYLTGPAAIADSALVCFEVDEILPLKLRELASYLRERNIGQLEIKKRGVEQDPEQIRSELKLRGDESATLLLTKFADRHIAILAHRVASRKCLTSECRSLTPDS